MDTLLKKLAEKGMLSAMDAEGIEKILETDAARWDKNKHPRGKGGKFVAKGSGSVSEGGKKEKNVESEHGAEKGTKAAGKARNKKEKARFVSRTSREVEKARQSASQSCISKANKYAKTEPETAALYKSWAESMSKPQAGRPTKEESKALTEKMLGNISSSLKPYAVEKYKKDLANEPAITNDLCDIADELGTEMFGLNFRLKKASDSSDGGCRIAEKIEEAMREKGMSYEKAADNLSDLVRYTQACTPENLVDQYERTRAILEKKGYKPVKVKNSWDSFSIKNAYRGVNTVFESPTGTKFELQFHTPESLVAKEVQHPQYEEQRKPGTKQARKDQLGQMMYENQKSLKRPRGIEKIRKYP